MKVQISTRISDPQKIPFKNSHVNIWIQRATQNHKNSPQQWGGHNLVTGNTNTNHSQKFQRKKRKNFKENDSNFGSH